MDQQFAYPTHASEGKDFIGLEDTLNVVLRGLGDTVAFEPAAQDVKALQPGHKDGTLYDPILQAQTIEMQCKAHVAMELLCQPTLHQSSVDSCLEGAQEMTECVMTMKVNDTDYRQPDALIPNHPAVTNFLRSQGRTMNYTSATTVAIPATTIDVTTVDDYRAAFNNVKQAKSFCWEHFNGLDLHGVDHPQKHRCANATWGGRAKDAHI